MANQATIDLAREVRRELAGDALTPSQAKLYSQRLRRDMGREGLATFTDADVEVYVDEALLLLQCALLERQDAGNANWRRGLKRAAEILEWLSQPSLKPVGAPLHLLAAASYQLADYPAMALGHLRRVPENEPFSQLLRAFLRADFPAALDITRDFWRARHEAAREETDGQSSLTLQALMQVVMCIGTLCAYLRTGEQEMVERALIKLEFVAAGFLHSRDAYSFLLARITAAASRRFVEASLWTQIEQLSDVSSPAVNAALRQFGRSAFLNCRALVWPSQRVGIERLRGFGSFVLCTPTGSGKTTIATLAIVQALFSDAANPPAPSALMRGNLALYLVPSRALAAEVENRLSQDLRGLAADPIIVTGLYGGVDWGPTDAWIQADRASIVICTFEKADALLRYLGVLFLDRVQLVIIDEVHAVEQDLSRIETLRDGSSRAFRLEQLGARLLRARDEYPFRIVALSAVAERAAPALARWVTGNPEATPTVSSYRSTRQMLGRLEVSAPGQFAIRYNLMDGRSLTFDDERRQDTPFVPRAFAPLPHGIDAKEGPEVRMRAPALWAALQLAAERPDGSTPSVLISLTQNLEGFAASCAELLQRWPEAQLPNYRALTLDSEVWTRCLASAADYFTTQSVEYRLLQRGIAVHHGKMPGLMARRLKAVIDQGYVRVIIATSTLSEGVNIPVSFLLIPSVFRGNTLLSLQEFSNLIGRVGRPGVSTEGSALVVLPERTQVRKGGHLTYAYNRQWSGYEQLVRAMALSSRVAAGSDSPEDSASSGLVELLGALEAAWRALSGSSDPVAFDAWLGQTAVVSGNEQNTAANAYLDSLDAFLIAAIQEVEELRRSEVSAEELEAELIAIWRRTYAYAAVGEEARLASTWLARGRVIKTQYPNADERRRIYKTSLSPRSATALIGLEKLVRTHLQSGALYSRWHPEQRFTFVRDTLALLTRVPSFRIEAKLGRKRKFDDWPTVLRWWIAKTTLEPQPAPKYITTWYEFVAQNFIYRGAWGIGSILGLLLDETESGEPVRALEIGDWPRSGLPWVAFWLKELITWGTLDPVAAYLLARGRAVDRPQAESDALAYYAQYSAEEDPNSLLDPRRIRDWVDSRTPPGEDVVGDRRLTIPADLSQPIRDYLRRRLTVAPIEIGEGIDWIDPAGYTVARSARPVNWPEQPSSFEFELQVADSAVEGTAYLQHL
jgi:superfamily II DNA/RNA helicase